MSNLKVTVGDESFTVRPGRAATFGRDSGCTVCLDPDDIGISRYAGRIEHRDALWWVTNLSRKHPLHVVDRNGMAGPLHPEAPGWPAPCLPVVGTLTVLVFGEQFRHRLILEPPGRAGQRARPPVPRNPVSTKSVLTPSDPWHRKVLETLAAGYLRFWDDYDPRPRRRSEVAEALGCSEQDVGRTLDNVAEALRRNGVSGIEGDFDRKLCEWYIVTSRLCVGPREITITKSVLSAEIQHLSRGAARAIKALLEPQLHRRYGENWRDCINAKHKTMKPSTLDDDRFCLRIYARDSVAHGLGTATSRQQALELLEISHRAHHNREITFDDARRARVLHDAIISALPC